MAPGGQTVQAAYDSSGRLASVEEWDTTSGPAFQRREYAYISGGINDGSVAQITFETWDASTAGWQAVRRVLYTYCGADDPNGLPGDLKTAVVQQATSTGWTPGDTTYYQYYTTDTGGGFPHGLERILQPADYSAALAYANSLTPPETVNQFMATATDAEAAPFTSSFFAYESTGNHRVTEAKTNHETVTCTYSYDPAVSTYTGTDNNYWTHEKIETRPDGSAYTVYTNRLGEVLLTDLYDPAASPHDTYTYTSYISDPGHLDDGEQTLQAQPSAVQSAAPDSYGNLNVVFTANGLVDETVYYPANPTSGLGTENTPGAAPGYPAYEYLRAAAGTSTPLFYYGQTSYPTSSWTLLKSYEYYAHTYGADNQVTYPLATETDYPDYPASTTGYTTTYRLCVVR